MSEALTLAIADWDYSWLLQTSGVGEEAYHLLPQCVAQLAARGFNALRVDAWPHLLAAQLANDVAGFDILPHQPSDKSRGSRQLRHISPKDRLLRLLQAGSENNIALWLTSWLLPDTTARRSGIRSADDLVRIWVATLEWLGQYDVLDNVVAVDLGHHFPDQPAGYGAWQGLFRRTPYWAKRGWKARSAKDVARINNFLADASSQLRTLYPSIRFGLSMDAARADQVHALDIDQLDFLDWHWGYNRQSPDKQHQLLDAHQGFCRMHGVQAVMTADSGPLGGHHRYLPELCRLGDQGVDRAREVGISVINPSRFARPQDALWDETAWLHQVTRRILS